MPEWARLACAIAMCDVAPPRPSRSISVRMLKMKIRGNRLHTYMMIMITRVDIDKSLVKFEKVVPSELQRSANKGVAVCYA